jgi:predicted house-cleaning noncanonical NTP pyrophosphatase (MazG superfamily)
MTVHNKPVRHGIPETILANGGKPVIRVSDEADYREALRTKLREDVKEYLDSGRVEELADIVEVIWALAVVNDSTWDEVERIRSRKVRERCDFSKRTFLLKS